ncbi:MAG TPA: PH domain-containing protein [Candidatus Lokiarchaeia archaeon]|nr:PH domain-containing protein [Candidatus Lokiarchaeia archaeon]
MPSENMQQFRPVQTKGGLILVITGVITIGLVLGVVISLSSFALLSLIIGIIAILGIGLLFCILALGYYRMCYLVGADRLILRWGFSKKVILLTTIETVGPPSTGTFDGIREGGVGIPGYRLGSFSMLIDGDYRHVTLVATDLSRLIIIKTTQGQYYGVTPNVPDEFIARVQQEGGKAAEHTVDTEPHLAISEASGRKHKMLVNVLFVASLAEAAIILLYTAFVYPLLPATVPVHYANDGTPNSYGSKSELLDVAILLAVIVIVIDLLIFVALPRKSGMIKIKQGTIVMLLPLVLGAVLLAITLWTVMPLTLVS